MQELPLLMIRISILAALLALLCIAGAAPVSTAFNYQGRLNRNDGPANGTFDLLFELFAVETGGTRIGSAIEKPFLEISGGLFTVDLNFGGPLVFEGTAYWLAISARPSNGANYTSAGPRVAIRPTPYAIHALSAAAVQDGAIGSNSLAEGAVTGSKLASGAVAQTQLNTVAAPAAGQVLAYNGNQLAWVTPSGGGGVSSPWLLNGSYAYYNGGNVGIGTSIPTTTLDVRGYLTLDSGTNSAVIMTGTGNTELNRYLGIFNSAGFASASGLKAGGVLVADDYFYAFPPKNDLIVKGKVGIGVPAPLAPLEVNGSWDATGIGHVRLTGNKPTVEWRTVGADAQRHSWIAHAGASNGLEFWYRRQAVGGGSDTGWQSKATFWPDGNLTVAGSITYAGGVSYGGDITATRLILRGDPAAPANAAVLCHDAAVENFVPYNTATGKWLNVYAGDVRAGRVVLFADPAATANVTVQTEDPNVSNFVPYNTATNRPLNLVVRDATVKQLTITGGADLAEPFAMSHDGLEPGTVVVIDEKNPGKLRRSTHAYDKKVAGIVSGANGIKPGISMIQEDMLEAGENVALSGRVFVKADTSAGSIEPGDLLTTSSTPGLAMKAADHDQAQGAILGKAMTGLTNSEGMVLVLVTLQ
jgi:hypothetical protein